MTDADAKPCLRERYLKATHSSHLENEARIRGDVDYLIAAGWCKEDVGTMLYRLSCEYDSVRAEVRGWPGNGDTERLMVLMKLKSLSPTKEAVGQWANVLATRRNFMTPSDPSRAVSAEAVALWREEWKARDRVVKALVGHVLNALLDASCPKCTGRGTIGGYGSPQAICRRCAGVGRIDQNIGMTDAERHFAALMLAELERMMAGVEVTMRRFLREGNVA